MNPQLEGIKIRYVLCRRIRSLFLTQNWGSSSGDLVNVEYHFLTIILTRIARILSINQVTVMFKIIRIR